VDRQITAPTHQEETMKRTLIALASIAVVCLPGLGLAGEKAPQAVVDFAQTELTRFSTDPVVVDAVKAQNAKGISLDEIKKQDEKWKADAGVAPYMKALMDSPCGKHLRAYQDANPQIVEMFLTDNQGANVALTEKTSDYWQGDEAKFIKSFQGGQGTLFLSEIDFDDSTQTYLVQASIPVQDGGQTIGVLVIGIDLDKL
jgi:hypothetical protein